MASKTQQDSGYKYPLPLDNGTRICVQMEIPDLPEYRNAVYAQITELGKWWNWKKTYIEGDQNASKAAELFRQLIAETFKFYDCEACPEMLDFRQHPTNVCLLQYSKDGGLTWIDMFDYSLCTPAPSTTDLGQTIDAWNVWINTLIDAYEGSPTDIWEQATWDGAGSNAIRSEVLCYAAKLFIEMVCEAGKAINDANEADLDNILNVAAIALGLASAVIAFAAGFVTFGASIGLGFAFAGGAAALVALINNISNADFNDEEAKAKVVCCLYDAIKEQTPTEAVWSTGLDDCTFDEDSSEEAIRLLGQALLSDNDVYLSILAFMSTGYQTIERGGSLPSDCECPNDIVIVPMAGQTWTTVEYQGGNTWRVFAGCNTGASPDTFGFGAEREGGGCFRVRNWSQNFPNSAAASPIYNPCAGGTANYPIPDGTCVDRIQLLYSVGCGISGQRWVQFEAYEDCS